MDKSLSLRLIFDNVPLSTLTWDTFLTLRGTLGFYIISEPDSHSDPLKVSDKILVTAQRKNSIFPTFDLAWSWTWNLDRDLALGLSIYVHQIISDICYLKSEDAKCKRIRKNNISIKIILLQIQSVSESWLYKSYFILLYSQLIKYEFEQKVFLTQ